MLEDFFEFAMDRVIPDWVDNDYSKPVLHLGPGNKHIIGTVELEWPDWDAESDKIPYPDNTVGGIMATHFFEHLADPRHCLEECLRVLAPGRALTLMVPHAQSTMYLQDLDHKTPYILDTWKVWLDNSRYLKGKPSVAAHIGVNIKMSIKEGNEALITQLIKD